MIEMTKFTKISGHEEMTAEEFRALVGELGLSQTDCARLLDVNDRTVRRWWSGETPPLPVAGRFLRYMVRARVSPIKVMETLAG
jgi:DNA-binding transcriptional regulator YiaG